MELDLGLVERRLATAFLGRRMVYHQSLPSTQDVARAEAEAGAPEGTVILAEEQTAGRGRLGRAWVSPPGSNLYLTLIMRPSVECLRSLGMVAPLAVVEAVEEVTGVSPRIKWPNDVLVGRRKLCGVLIDTGLVGSGVMYALVGIGLNVNLDVGSLPEIAQVATSLRCELGREVPREEVLAALLNRFEGLYRAWPEGPQVFEAWRSRLETLGQRVRVAFGNQREEGVAEDVDREGCLLLRRDDGSLIRLAAGEVTLREA